MLKELDEADIEKTYAWSRYLYRTVKIKTKADAELNQKKKIDGIFSNEMQTLYFALLYVTIEAYKGYKFSDKRIDCLLDTKNKININLLFGLRNSVFHPDPSVKFHREIDLLNNANKIIPWAYLLTDEFERFLFFYPERNGFNGKAADKLRKEIKKVNNWLPCNSFMIKKKKGIDHIFKSREFVKKNYPDRIDEYNELTEKLLFNILNAPDPFKEDEFMGNK